MQSNAPGPVASRDNSGGHLALTVSLIYAVTASLYILLSDRILAWLIPDPDLLSMIQSAKGLAFVLVTAAVLYLVLRRELRRYDAVNDSLRASTETLQAVIDAAPISIIALDREGRVTLWNPASEQIFGWQAAEAMGQLNPIVPPDKMNEFQGYMALLAEGKGLRGVEVHRQRRDGTLLDISLSTAPVRDRAGQVVGFIGLHEDISEQKRSQAALRESETRFRLLFASNPQPMWAYDEETLRFIEVNEAAVARYGYSRDEFLGMTIKDIRPEEDVPRLLEMVSGHRLSDLNPAGTWRHRLKDGTIIYVDIISHSIDLDGRRARLVVAHDVTRRVQAEEQMERRSRELSALLDSAQRLIQQPGLPERLQISVSAVIDALPTADAAALWLYDAERGDLVIRAQAGAAPTALPGLAASPEGGVPGRVFRTRQTVILEDAQQQADSVPPPEGVRALLAVPLLYQGQAIGVLLAASTQQAGAFGRDDLRLLEALAAQAASAIQNARYFRRLRELSARLSEVETRERQQLARELHDQAGQILTALGINLSVVLQMVGEEAAPAVRQRLAESLDLVADASGRIRDVMANLRPPVLDDYGLVAALRWYGEHFARLTGVAFSLTGEEPEPRLAPVVENALYRIMQEALTNVARHAQASHVTAQLESVGRRVRLMIVDDGVGFDRDQARRQGGHHGWGLATMTERAEMFGGTCLIESKPGEGTRITVEVKR